MFIPKTQINRHDYTIGTLDVLQAFGACADMGITYSVIVQCADCVVFPNSRIYPTSTVASKFARFEST